MFLVTVRYWKLDSGKLIDLSVFLCRVIAHAVKGYRELESAKVVIYFVEGSSFDQNEGFDFSVHVEAINLPVEGLLETLTNRITLLIKKIVRERYKFFVTLVAQNGWVVESSSVSLENESEIDKGFELLLPDRTGSTRGGMWPSQR